MKKRILLLGMLLGLLFLPARGAQEGGAVALTFDDGPSGRFTERLLEELGKRQVRATFFLCGYRVEQYPALAARIREEGHEIGSHGDSHRYFKDMTPEELRKELSETEEKILRAAGVQPALLRPPGGLCPEGKLPLPVILWSVDAEDWHRSDAEGIARDILREAEPGDVILLHDMSDSSVQAALEVIDGLLARGIRPVTVSELAAEYGRELVPGEIYRGFS